MSFEQRANIKFCFKISKTFIKTFELMKTVYGDDCLFRARVHEWFTRFRDGREHKKETVCTGLCERTVKIVIDLTNKLV